MAKQKPNVCALPLGIAGSKLLPVTENTSDMSKKQFLQPVWFCTQFTPYHHSYIWIGRTSHDMIKHPISFDLVFHIK